MDIKRNIDNAKAQQSISFIVQIRDEIYGTKASIGKQWKKQRMFLYEGNLIGI